MSPHRPFFSIITATRDSAEQIRPLLYSIQRQRFDDFEWIVQDGASTDGTVDTIRSAKIGRVELHSSADDGIYDAFNRAVDRARGTWLLFLGSDDRFADEHVLGRAHDRLGSTGDTVAALFCAVRYGHDGAVVRPRLDWRTNMLNTAHHQGAFYRRDVFERFRYRTDVPVVADYELNFLLWKRRTAFVQCSDIVAVCGDGGISRTENEWQLYRRLHRLRTPYMPRAVSVFWLALGEANVLRRHLSRRSPG